MTIKKLFYVAWVKYIEDCYQNYHLEIELDEDPTQKEERWFIK